MMRKFVICSCKKIVKDIKNVFSSVMKYAICIKKLLFFTSVKEI